MVWRSFPRGRYIPAELLETARNSLHEERRGPQSSLGHDAGAQNSLLFRRVAEIEEEGPAGVVEEGGERFVGEEGNRGDGGDVGSGGEGGEWREGDIAGEGVWDRKGLEGGEFERGSGAGDSRGVAERVVGREVEEVGETGETLSGREGGRGGEGVSQGGVD